MRKPVTRIHRFPAGEYYIGDPCYVVKDENWRPLLDDTGYFGSLAVKDNGSPVVNWDDGLFSYNFRTCFTHGTAYGDGGYDVRMIANGKNEYVGEVGVDAGEIAIMPLDAVDDIDEAETLGVIYTFEDEFEVCYSSGTFYFGDLEIKTS